VRPLVLQKSSKEMEEVPAQTGEITVIISTREDEIWTVEAMSRQAGGECIGERDLDRKISVYGPLAIGTKRSCMRFNPRM
jgi:hypothetical protein